MSDVKIKICGITNYADANKAVELGADMIGFNFFEQSPRFITPDKAMQIVKMLPGFINIVGVFVNATHEEINETMNICPLNWIQLHGDEDPDFCKGLHWHNAKIIKVIGIRDKSDFSSIKKYLVDAFLFDTFDPKLYGGTGKTFDWSLIGDLNSRVFLAGGIDPDNVAQAAKLGVYAVDICSGIEEHPGKKDHKKLEKVFENIGLLRR